jgi:1-acyl-sn-glycerol-3-phosphate acyltransferase
MFPRVRPARRASITRWWSSTLLGILNIELVVRGFPPLRDARNVIIASNHVSWVDIFVINAAHPSRFIAKAEIRDWPIAGWMVDRAGTIFIRRTRRSDTAKINETMHNVLAEGATIGFFPEGTTTGGDTLLKFHTSLFEPAVVNEATLAPAAICYRDQAGRANRTIAFIGELSFTESVGRIIGQGSLVAEITFAAPIKAAGMTRRELATLAEAAVAGALELPMPNAHQRFAG